MPGNSIPALDLPRPALAMIESLGYARPEVSFQDFQDAIGKPKSTVSRLLRELTNQSLILRVKYDLYAIPRRSTVERLLLEPIPYVRSLLVHADVFGLRKEPRWAVACVPIRRFLTVEIDRAIPVLPPDDRLIDRTGRPYPDVLWYNFPRQKLQKAPLAEITGRAQDRLDGLTALPTLAPELGLALLMSTLDPRFVEATKEAASLLGIPLQLVVRHAKGLQPEVPPLKTIHPNTIVFPEWLERFWETSRHQRSRGIFDQLLAAEDRGEGRGGAARDA